MKLRVGCEVSGCDAWVDLPENVTGIVWATEGDSEDPAAIGADTSWEVPEGWAVVGTQVRCPQHRPAEKMR